MTQNTSNILQIEDDGPVGVYDSGEAVQLTLETMAERKAAMADDRAVSNMFGIPEIDELVVPLWPGDYAFTIGLPSNGKSFLARMQALRILNMLMSGNHTDRVVVWATAEESVERVTTAWLAAISGVSATDMLSGKLSNVHSVTVNAAVSEVASWPLYVIGHVLGNHSSGTSKHTSSRLSTADIEACLDYIRDGREKQIVFFVMDYLQRVRKPLEISNREEHIRLTVDWGRDIANKFSTPVNMVTQAKFSVFDRSIPVPGLEDSEWSANAGQSADTMFSVWMPQTKPGVGEVVNYGKWRNLIVERGMLFVYVAKQKMGEAQVAFLLRAQPHLMKWELLEIQEIDLNSNSGDAKIGASNSRAYFNEWPQQAQVPFGD